MRMILIWPHRFDPCYLKKNAIFFKKMLDKFGAWVYNGYINKKTRRLKFFHQGGAVAPECESEVLFQVLPENL